jgi:hypothetical protein
MLAKTKKCKTKLQQVPVNIVKGALPPMSDTNSLYAQLNPSIVSSDIRIPTYITVWKWLLTPTNNPNGILYRFVV